MADSVVDVYKGNDDNGSLLTFSRAGRDWLEDRRKKISAVSADRYEYLFGKYLVPMFGDADVHALTRVEINMKVAGLGDKEIYGENAVSAKTMRMLQSMANCIVEYVRNGGKGYIKLENVTGAEGNPSTALLPEEIEKIVSCAKHHRSPEMLGVLFALFLGMGTGELCALSWDDIDVAKRQVSIRNTLYRVKDNSGGMDGRKATKLAVMSVRKSAVRTLEYPEELSEYVEGLFRPGTVLLTGEKGRYMEQRTLLNHIEELLKVYGFERMEVRRLTKTYKEGLADIWYIKEVFSLASKGTVSGGLPSGSETLQGGSRKDERAGMHSAGESVDEKSLMKEMGNDLEGLRLLLGMSVYDMGQFIGLSEGEYLALEAGEAPMDWSCFLSLLFIFKYNPRTEGVVDALGLYPESLRERIALRG